MDVPESFCESRGRHGVGERHPRARLTEKQVVEIRRRVAEAPRGRGGRIPYGLRQQLAAEYGVTVGIIKEILAQRTWMGGGPRSIKGVVRREPDPHPCECGDHVWAPLTQGYVTLVSPEDAGLLDEVWCASINRTNKSVVYAARYKRRLHREILPLPPETMTDHVNLNGTDNRRSNLRVATASDNCANQRKKPGSNPYKGVMVDEVRRPRRPFWAQIKINYQRVFLGSFATAEAAARAYDAAAREAWGEFALVNFPDDQP